MKTMKLVLILFPMFIICELHTQNPLLPHVYAANSFAHVWRTIRASYGFIHRIMN